MPGICAAAALGTGAALGAKAAVVGGLHALGFGTGGVVGGSVAAGAQAAIYGGSTTGVFSLLQSAGTVVLGPVAIVGAVGGVAAVAAISVIC